MMGSLDRAPILDGLVAAIDGPVVTEPKLDGLAARSVYNTDVCAWSPPAVMAAPVRT